MPVRLRFLLLLVAICCSAIASGQETYWQQEPVSESLLPADHPLGNIDKSTVFELNPEALAADLSTISSGKISSKPIFFPIANGDLKSFQVTERPVMAPELSRKYPQIRSYIGYSTSDPELRIRFSVSHHGIQTMIYHSGSEERTFMQPFQRGSRQYIVYKRDPLSERMADFLCETKDSGLLAKEPSTQRLVDDQTLRKFRLAVSATGEYTVFHGGTVADALAAINATLTRVNEVFETDLGVTLELIANNDLVIFTDPSTDPYGGNLNAEVQSELTATIGELNYDIGHLFHEDTNGGNAGFIGAVCVDNQKGSAFSAGLNPQGDLFDLDFVSHEMGHQFGANHTWSFDSEGTQVQAEPGSGSTIMGYAGIAGPNNVTSNGDDYFHYYSIFQITEYLAGVTCAQEIALTNNPPEIIPVQDHTIPIGTAFVLSGSASDPDLGDALTYTWEQIDNGVVTNDTFGPDQAAGANFRSRPPTSEPDRYFPKLSEVAQGNLTQTNPTVGSAWETVSNVSRDMNFALTVRDNAAGGGQVASDLVKISVTNTAGPFSVTSQAGAETYSGGSVQTITWDVAGTNSAPINCQIVDIFVSFDGGASFPEMVADDVLNDGSHEVIIPGTATTEGRIMVRAADNIFFAVNTTEFTITESEIVLDLDGLDAEVCQPANLDIPFTYEAYGGFSESSTFSVTGLPAGVGSSFTPPAASADNTPVTLTLTNTGAAATGSYPIIITATATSASRDVPVNFIVRNDTFGDVTLSSPADGATDVSLTTTLDWEANPDYTAYDLEIASDAGFITKIETATVVFNTYEPQNLNSNTQYFWRVKPKNSCGEGIFGPSFQFTTVGVNCLTRSATDLPQTISASGTPTITSSINFINDLAIADLNLSVELNHTFLSDLIIKLISPSGTEVVLTSNSCGQLRNINATFDDDGIPFTCSGDPAISGTVKALGALSSFNGESSLGTWTLEVNDTANADGGALIGFSIEMCVEGVFRPDDDGDGVFDDGDDLCLGTPPNSEVDVTGCRIYRFSADNFTVELESETCASNNDGSITISAAETLDYQINVTGNGLNEVDTFTNSYTLNNLSAGIYDICITATEGVKVYEPLCFTVVIDEPDPLNVSGILSPDGLQLTLILSGSSEYTIDLNGVISRTSASTFILDLKQGNNTVKVTTDLPCQGSYEEEVFASSQPILYPNPFSNDLSAFLGRDVQTVQVRVFNYSGSLVLDQQQATNGREFQLDFRGLPPGVYFVQLVGDSIEGTYKVIKR